MMHLRTLLDWDGDTVLAVLERAGEIKSSPEKFARSLSGRVLGMYFEKTSTRTRVSFEAGMTRLGGHAIYLDGRTTNVKEGVALADEVRCLDRYCDALTARVGRHETVETFVRSSRVPVINALCDRYHPCQALADLLTVKEKTGGLSGRKLAYVGDGNNVCNSLIIAAARTGLSIAVATPPTHRPLPEAIACGEEAGVLEIGDDPRAAAREADAVYTDTWVSMGQEDEKKERLGIFRPYQVNRDLLGKAWFLHCLPAYRGLEVTDEVLDSDRSAVFDQAENRLHAQNAVLLACLDL
jgi:ornithine carbamoyltransferase